MIYNVLDNQKALKTLSRLLHSFKVEENLRTFQGKMELIQGLPLNVRTFQDCANPVKPP